MFVWVDEKDNFASLNDQISVVHLYADSEREDILKRGYSGKRWLGAVMHLSRVHRWGGPQAIDFLACLLWQSPSWFPHMKATIYSSLCIEWQNINLMSDWRARHSLELVDCPFWAPWHVGFSFGCRSSSSSKFQSILASNQRHSVTSGPTIWRFL